MDDESPASIAGLIDRTITEDDSRNRRQNKPAGSDDGY
jgi:hypothetical protein